jgi:hypothetical protein
VFVPLLRFHCRWGIILLAVLVMVAAALVFLCFVRVQVVGWLYLDVGPNVAAS